MQPGTPIRFLLARLASFAGARDRLPRERAGSAHEPIGPARQRALAIFDNAAVGITEVDAHGRFMAVNERMCALTGYSREELLGMRWNDITAPEDRTTSEEAGARLRGGQLERIDYDKRYVRRDGSRLWGHVTASAVRDEAGRFLYAVGTIEDISERKRAQESLSLLSQAIESAANGVLLADRDRRILWVNPAFTAVSGYSAEDCLSRTVSILESAEHPAGFYRKLWEGVLAGNPWRGPLVNRRKDGSLYHADITITPVRTQGSEVTHIVIVAEDIGERVRAEDSLRAARASAEHAQAQAERARAEAEQANQAKDHFLAVLSHELRTPLTPVLAAVELMQRRPGLHADLQMPLEVMRRNLQLEARLIDDLLDLTRIVQGKLELERKPIRIDGVVERAVEIARPDLAARKLHFVLDIEERPLMVNGDGSRLQQVVWNLISNAVKFTPDGGCVGIRCREENARAVVEVSDSGMGIEPEALARIFGAFEQGGRAITRQFGGLGLGLSIARRLVELHGGEITAHSDGANRGATFRVSLPLCTAAAVEPPAPRRPAPAASRRILLVEDNGDTLEMMRMLLESFGYEVETAGDAAQALEALDARSFDLLISDLGLPGRSGVELMREIRSRGTALKGIALSGYGREDDVRRSREAGFSVHLTKPVDADALAQTLSRLV